MKIKTSISKTTLKTSEFGNSYHSENGIFVQSRQEFVSIARIEAWLDKEHEEKEKQKKLVESLQEIIDKDRKGDSTCSFLFDIKKFSRYKPKGTNS